MLMFHAEVVIIEDGTTVIIEETEDGVFECRFNIYEEEPAVQWFSQTADATDAMEAGKLSIHL